MSRSLELGLDPDQAFAIAAAVVLAVLFLVAGALGAACHARDHRHAPLTDAKRVAIEPRGSTGIGGIAEVDATGH